MRSDCKVSIIINSDSVYNSLERLLKLISNQTVQPFEVIISGWSQVNDKASDFYEKFKELPIKKINFEGSSHTQAQNIGARASTGGILIFLEDDCEFPEDFVEQHINVMEEENVDAVVGSDYFSEELFKKDEKHEMKRMDPLSYLIEKESFNCNSMVIYTNECNMSIKRDFFLSAGGYDEGIPLMADVELGLRLYKIGAKIYQSVKPLLRHIKSNKGDSIKAQRYISYLRLVSFLYIYKKHFPGWSTHQFCLKEILGALLFRDSINGKTNLSNFRNPFYTFIGLYKLTRANIQAARLLNQSNRK
jgi:GT2 family glycosyltransferase